MADIKTTITRGDIGASRYQTSSLNPSEVIDSFTVLQNVENQFLQGRIYEALEYTQDESHILMGYKTAENSFSPSTIGGQANVTLQTGFERDEDEPQNFDIEINSFNSKYEQPLQDTQETNIGAVFIETASNLNPQNIEQISIPNSAYYMTLGTATLSAGAQEGVSIGDDVIFQSPKLNVSGRPILAETPSLQVRDAFGIEDEPVALFIDAALTDIDGTETLYIDVIGVPEGASLSGGRDLGGGQWRLTPDDLEDISITFPDHFSGDVPLIVRAVSTEVTGDIAINTGLLNVSVAPIVDPALLRVAPAIGFEDQPIDLDISPRLIDNDGSETLSLVTIFDVPAGAQLSAGRDNGDGSYSLTVDELDGLSIQAPLHSNEDFSLRVEVTSTESDGKSVTVSAIMPVSITGVADTPNVEACFGGVRTIGGGEITAENALRTDLGFEILAQNINTDGTLSDALAENVGLSGNGFGASGDTDNSNVDAETGWDPEFEVSEALIVNFDQLVIDSHVEFGYFFRDWTGGVENGTVTAYRGGQEVGSLHFHALQGDTLDINIGSQPYDQLIFKAQPYSNEDDINPIHVSMDSSDFTIKRLTFSNVEDVPMDTLIGMEDTAIAFGFGLKSSLVDDDGSETLTYTIGDVPEGAVLSAGINNGDGTYTLSAAELENVALSPPPHFSGTIPLTFSVVTSENDGDQAGASVGFNIIVEAVADRPVLQADNASGFEDLPIDLNITSELVDLDGSESLTLFIRNVPEDAYLSKGTIVSDGVYEITSDDLDGLQLFTRADSNDNFQLNVEARSEDENGDVSSHFQTIYVTIKGIADDPFVSAQDVAGVEDTRIPMDFSGRLNDIDGSESLYFEIRDLPEGVSFTTGRAVSGGRHWRFNNLDQAERAEMIPPQNFSGVLDMTLRAYAHEDDGDKNFVDTDFHVVIDGVADAPRSFSVRQARGFEDQDIALDIRYTLQDNDGSEQFSIVISDFPEGTGFSHGEILADGRWYVHQDDIAHLNVVAPPHSNEDFVMQVSGYVTEDNGDVYNFPNALALPVYVRGVADMPGIDAHVRTGQEDQPLDIQLGGYLGDLDGSEMLSVVISNIPDGVLLSPQGTYVSQGTYSYTAQQASALILTPPKDFSGRITLDVKAIAQENDGDVETFQTPLHINIDAVADAPKISGRASVLEDTSIQLDINIASLDRDGSEVIADTIIIRGVPNGAELSSGQPIGNGAYSVSLDDLDGLSIRPPLHSNENFSLTIEARSIDDNGDEAVSVHGIMVDVTGVSDAPLLSVLDAYADQGRDIPLSIEGQLIDPDGSEHLYFILEDVPDTFHVIGGIAGGAGVWVVPEAHISDVSLRALTNRQDDFDISVKAVSVENDGDISYTQHPLHVRVDGHFGEGLPSESEMSKLARFDAYLGDDVDEDQEINVDGMVHFESNGTLSFLITDIPDGVEPNLGFYNLNGGLIVPVQDIADLRFSPIADFSGEITMVYTAIQIQQGKQASAVSKLATVDVEAIADKPLIKAQAFYGGEDHAIAIPIHINISDKDGSEFLGDEIRIENLPDGAHLSHGDDLGDGVWAVPLNALSDLSLTPPINWHGVINLKVSATSIEADNLDQASTLQTITVHVEAIADRGILSVSDAQGIEDEWIDVHIDAAFVDSDGSETMSIVIAGLPEEARLSAGLNNGDGSWTLKQSQITGLKLRAPDDFSGRISALVALNTIDAGGVVAQVTSPFLIDVAGVADALTLDPVLSYSSAEDDAFGVVLQFKAQSLDRDGSEVVEILFSNLPMGATFSSGVRVSENQWLLQGPQVEDVVFYPPADFSGPIALDVRIDTIEPDGARGGIDVVQNIYIQPVADTPDVVVGTKNHEGLSGQKITLDIDAMLNDQDGSETLAVRIRDVPDEVTFENAQMVGQGVWLFEDIDAESFEMESAAEFEGEFNVVVQSLARESSNGDTAYSAPENIFFTLYPSRIQNDQGDWVDTVLGNGQTASNSQNMSWDDAVSEETNSGPDNIQEADTIDDIDLNTHNGTSDVFETTNDHTINYDGGGLS